MIAKSIPSFLLGARGMRLRRNLRTLASLLVLAAGITALALVTQGRHGLSEGSVVPNAADVRQEPTAAAIAGPVAHPDADRHRAISEFLAKRYRVSQEVIFDLVGIAHATGRQLGLDPLLIIAVIAVESRFNPIAESVAGAKGLMQIIPRYHADKLQEFGGEKALFDPEANIVVGARILKEYLGRTGNLGIALQMYAGALNDEQDLYTGRVMSEQQRLQQVVSRSAASALQTASRGTRL